jgi:hypothetical protein
MCRMKDKSVYPTGLISIMTGTQEHAHKCIKRNTRWISNKCWIPKSAFNRDGAILKILEDSEKVLTQLYQTYRTKHQFAGYQGVWNPWGMIRFLNIVVKPKVCHFLLDVGCTTSTKSWFARLHQGYQRYQQRYSIDCFHHQDNYA